MRAKVSKTSQPTKAISTSKPCNPLPRPKPSTSSSSFYRSNSSESTFANSKSDKRIIKHSAFVSRVEKSSTKKSLKRRRPNKKLVTTLESLADALPDVEELVRVHESGDGLKANGQKKLESKSLSHGKGFMKRRDKVEKGEKERFGKNLGVIMGSVATPAASATVDVGKENAGAEKSASTTAGRFAAIRAWVNDNMEKHEGFEKKG
jgi:hypothetical protein